MIPLNHVAAERARDAVITQRTPTPALVIDPEKIRDNLARIRTALPSFELCFATKCNPAPSVLRLISHAGGGFEIASLSELELVLRNGGASESIVFSAPVKRPSDILGAWELGVNNFSAGSRSEVDKILTLVPDALVSLRLSVGNDDARWPLDKRWGFDTAEALLILKEIDRKRAAGAGLSFHVGSQSTSSAAWTIALESVSEIISQSPIEISVLNIGGGLPGPQSDLDHHRLWDEIGSSVEKLLRDLPYRPSRLIVEPGRAVVADAGVMVGEILDVSNHKSETWVHLDVGVFNGMYESSAAGGGLTKDPILFDREISVLEPMRIAGASCDPDDVLAVPMPMPVDVRPGELVAFPDCGAYSLSYASDFCGLGQPSVVILDERSDLLRHEVYEPGSIEFERACDVEFGCFERAGFVDDDGSLFSVRRLDSLSRMIVLPAEDGSFSGVLRLIDATNLGFATLHTMIIDAHGEQLLAGIDMSTTVEVLTSAPRRRDPVVALDLYRAVMLDSIIRGKTHIVASMDDWVWKSLNRRFSSDQWVPFQPLGPSKFYVGSDTSPVLLDVWACEHHLDMVNELAQVAARYRTMHRSAHRT